MPEDSSLLSDLSNWHTACQSASSPCQLVSETMCWRNITVHMRQWEQAAWDRASLYMAETSNAYIILVKAPVGRLSGADQGPRVPCSARLQTLWLALWNIQIYNKHHGYFFGSKPGRGVELTTHLHTVLRSQWMTVILPLLHTSSSRGV